jgi:hypothetical protein
MKSILSLAFALAALFSVNTVSAQKANPKISNPDKADVRITGTYQTDGSYKICVEFCRITGLGDASTVEASLTCVATADVSCYNKGQQKQDPAKVIPGQSSTTTGDAVPLQAKNGNLILEHCSVSVTIAGDCKNTNDTNGFLSEVANVNVSDLFLTLNGKTVSLQEFINQLD